MAAAWAAALLATGLAWAWGAARVATLTTMGSGSMAPALLAGSAPDVVLVDRWTPRRRPPRRGEIVRFRDPEGTWVMKRVVGLPGETVALTARGVVVDGELLAGPPAVTDLAYQPDGHLAPGRALQLGPGYYLVLGDDTRDSYDSRYWGGLARARITGIARYRVWPPGRVGALGPSLGP